MKNNSNVKPKSQRGDKPKFNKKKWRETQFSHKHKVSEWESKRKLAVTRKYNKMMKKDDNTNHFKIQEIYSKEGDTETNADPSSSVDGTDTVPDKSFQPRERLSQFQRAKLNYEKVQQDKEQKRMEKAQRLKEREEAIKKSKQLRMERIKKLTQKTKKGQPVMKGRIEILLEKIQKQASDST